MRKHFYRILGSFFCHCYHGRWGLRSAGTAGIAASDAGSPKNVILIIGDGMGPEQVGLLARLCPPGARYGPLLDRKTALDRIMDPGGVMGISMTYPEVRPGGR